MANRTFTVTNRSKGERILHDAAGRAISFAAGQIRNSIQLADTHARTLHARGGAWHIGGSLGGAGRRVEAREQTGEGADSVETTPQQDARTLIDRSGEMSFAELKEEAKAFLGDRGLPRGKEALIAKLEAFARS